MGRVELLSSVVARRTASTPRRVMLEICSARAFSMGRDDAVVVVRLKLLAVGRMRNPGADEWSLLDGAQNTRNFCGYGLFAEYGRDGRPRGRS